MQKQKGGGKPQKRKLAPMTPQMEFFYRAWLSRPKLFGDPTDEHYFYLFVKSVVENSKQPRDGEWLRGHLEREGHICEAWIRKAVQRFDICREYDKSMRKYCRGVVLCDDPRLFEAVGFMFEWDRG